MHKLPTSIPNAGSWGHIAQMNTMFNHYVRPTCEGFLHKFIKFRTHKFADSLHFGMDGYVEPFCLYDNESYCASERFPPISDFSQTIYFAWFSAYFGQNSLPSVGPKPWHVAVCWPIYGHGYYKLWLGYWFAVAILLLRVLTVDSWVTRSLSGAGGAREGGIPNPRGWTRFVCVMRYKCIYVSIARCVLASAITVNVQCVDSFPF